MSRKSYQGLILISLLAAAHGCYWFFGGSARAASDLRNATVGLQIAVGFAVAVWAWWRSRRLAS